jgi:5-methylcytosine-specific restriction endonuclease McrA
MKKKVWEKEFEDICDSDDDVFELNPKCPVYKCKTKIIFNNFEMGHLRSVANGGSSTINNLRPICRQCNQKMSDTNWADYERDIKKELRNNK